MVESIEIIKSLDQIRVNQKMTIQDLVEGIMSRKTYTRLLNNESSISFFYLAKLLAKLSIPFQEFSLHVVTAVENEFPNESGFYLSVIRELYREAYHVYYPLIKDKNLKTVFGKKAVPAVKELLFYKLGKLTKKEALCNLNAQFDSTELINQKIIHDGLAGILYAYVYVTDDHMRRKIGRFVHAAIYDPNYKYYVSYPHIAKMILHLTGIQALMMLEAPTRSDEALLEKIILYALTYQAKYRISIFEHKLFKILYTYQKQKGYKNEHIDFYYISSYLSMVGQNQDFEPLRLTKADMKNFKKYLKDNIFKQKQMYEGILSDGKIW